MKKSNFFPVILLCALISTMASAQSSYPEGFKMAGNQLTNLVFNQVFTRDEVLEPPGLSAKPVYGMAVSGQVSFQKEDGYVRVVLVDRDLTEHLVFESYPLISESETLLVSEVSEETAVLAGIQPRHIRLEVENATFELKTITVAGAGPQGPEIARLMKEKQQLRNDFKIKKLNQNLRQKGASWVAGQTEVSQLSYAAKKKLYGGSKFPAGFEFYAGGIYQTESSAQSATASPMVEDWDWRDRHGKNWITGIRNQASCGSCWAFAATGATEAQVNLYFNQLLNLDLSEQDILSCSGAGSCDGGQPGTALNYIAKTGMVDEAAFPYTATDQPCSNKNNASEQLIKIAGRVDFATVDFPREEDALKKMIIRFGPLSGGILNWSHAMTLVGWKTIREGDHFYTRDLEKSTYWITIPVGSPLIGTTVWIFKNSWGNWGDAGYVFIQTSMGNIGWTHALLNPVQSLKQSYTVKYQDADGDGYYWWGLGTKPAGCPGPDLPDGNDTDATLGPLDEYGYCMQLNQSPSANFSADLTTPAQGGQVAFTDLSSNLPSAWTWSFPGGTPSSSSSQNPAVTYGTPGTYDVTLTVSNSNGTSTVTKTGYITVSRFVPAYCNSYGNASREWIAGVTLNGIANQSASGGTIGYQDFTGISFSAQPGSTSTVTLVPGFSAKASTECFVVWIDFNQDSDFDDAGEQVVKATKVKSTITQKFTVPSSALSGTTRMRVSMKRNNLPAPCEIIPSGEVEDYTIQIGGAALKSASVNPTDNLFPGKVRIYPNPASDRLILETSENGPGNRLEVFSLTGNRLMSEAITETRTSIDVSSLKPGLYIMEVRQGAVVTREKFIKQ